MIERYALSVINFIKCLVLLTSFFRARVILASKNLPPRLLGILIRYGRVVVPRGSFSGVNARFAPKRSAIMRVTDFTGAGVRMPGIATSPCMNNPQKKIPEKTYLSNHTISTMRMRSVLRPPNTDFSREPIRESGFPASAFFEKLSGVEKNAIAETVLLPF